jgi:hypothetical protein
VEYVGGVDDGGDDDDEAQTPASSIHTIGPP